MLICLACRRHDGDHALNCGYIAGPDHDSLARTFMDDNADLFESVPLTHNVPTQTTDEFLLAILAEPSHLERYEHSMAMAEPNDAFDQRMKDVMAEMNAIEAASLRTTRALMSWPEVES